MESTRPSSIPFEARPSRHSITIPLTCPARSGSVPRSPAAKTSSFRSVSSPLTGERSSPSPLSTRRLSQGRAGAADQHFAQDLMGQDGLRIRDSREEPAHRHAGARGKRGAGLHGESLFKTTAAPSTCAEAEWRTRSSGLRRWREIAHGSRQEFPQRECRRRGRSGSWTGGSSACGSLAAAQG